MSIFNKIKRKLPVVGNSAPALNPASRSPSASTAPGPAPEPEPVSPRGDAAVGEFLAAFVKSKPVVLFMKGSPAMPMCGFSANAAGILSTYDVEMAHFDVLSDPQVRKGIKEFSQWPTLPQVYVHGEFIGGSDILMQMHQSGELKELLAPSTAG